MKKLVALILIFFLNQACSNMDQSSDLSQQRYTSSAQTDTIVSILTHEDSILFPKTYILLEELIEPAIINNSHYYGCLKFSHPDILQFVKINMLKIDDRSYGVFQPFDMPLKKEALSYPRSVYELRKQSFDLFADTVEDKLYISKWFLEPPHPVH